MSNPCKHENAKFLKVTVDGTSLTMRACPDCKCFLSLKDSPPLPFEYIIHNDTTPYIPDALPTRPQLLQLLEELAKDAVWETPSKFKPNVP